MGKERITLMNACVTETLIRIWFTSWLGDKRQRFEINCTHEKEYLTLLSNNTIKGKISRGEQHSKALQSLLAFDCSFLPSCFQKKSRWKINKL